MGPRNPGVDFSGGGRTENRCCSLRQSLCTVGGTAELMTVSQLDLRRELKSHGMRMTPQRQLILEAIVSLSGHISADAVHQRVVRVFPNVNISTVYRTLELLQDLGYVTHTHFDDGVAQYHLADDGVHQHLVCRRCGGEQELDMATLDPLARGLRESYGFDADLAHFAIVGLCRGCQPSSATTSSRVHTPAHEHHA